MSQVIQYDFPKELLTNLLKSYCSVLQDDYNYYIFDRDSFKKILFDNKLNDFIKSIKPYYYKSKLKYLERKLSFTFFLTILRQLCKYKKIYNTSEVTYSHGTYNIKYYIMIDN